MEIFGHITCNFFRVFLHLYLVPSWLASSSFSSHYSAWSTGCPLIAGIWLQSFVVRGLAVLGGWVLDVRVVGRYTCCTGVIGRILIVPVLLMRLAGVCVGLLCLVLDCTVLFSQQSWLIQCQLSVGVGGLVDGVSCCCVSGRRGGCCDCVCC